MALSFKCTLLDRCAHISLFGDARTTAVLHYRAAELLHRSNWQDLLFLYKSLR